MSNDIKIQTLSQVLEIVDGERKRERFNENILSASHNRLIIDNSRDVVIFFCVFCVYFFFTAN